MVKPSHLSILPGLPSGPIVYWQSVLKLFKKASYSPVCSDILIHDQLKGGGAGGKIIKKKKKKTPFETNSGSLTNYQHISPLAPTSQLHLIGNTLLCSTHTFHVGFNSVSKPAFLNIRVHD